MSFNPSKTEVLTISNKTNQKPHPPLFLNGVKLNEVQHHSHLGLTLSNNMSWDTPIGVILRKASRTLNVIKALKFKLPRQTLSKLYCTMIRPILEYANVVFDNMPSHLSDALERFQYQAGLVCSGALHGTSRVAVLQDLGWPTLAERREIYKLSLMFKIYNNLAPQYLVDLLLEDNRSHIMPLCHTYQSQVLCSTLKLQKSFFPSSIFLWNSLPQDILRLTNVNAFRKALYHHKLLLRPPSYYSFGPRWLNIMHTRIRLNNSFLNSCLYARNMVDSPNCVCGDYENIVHFLFYCPRYMNIRWSLFVALGNILLPGVAPHLLVDHIGIDNIGSICLYGSTNLNHDQNISVF